MLLITTIIFLLSIFGWMFWEKLPQKKCLCFDYLPHHSMKHSNSWAIKPYNFCSIFDIILFVQRSTSFDCNQNTYCFSVVSFSFICVSVRSKLCKNFKSNYHNHLFVILFRFLEKESEREREEENKN